jgi:hypothetical protein
VATVMILLQQAVPKQKHFHLLSPIHESNLEIYFFLPKLAS